MYFKTSWPPASLEITINISAPENLFALKCYNFVRRRFFEIMPKISKWLYVTSKKWSLDKLIDFWRCCKNVFIPQDLIFLSLADIIPTVNDIFGLVCTLLTSFYPPNFQPWVGKLLHHSNASTKLWIWPYMYLAFIISSMNFQPWVGVLLDWSIEYWVGAASTYCMSSKFAFISTEGAHRIDKPARLSFSCSLDLVLNERREW